MLCQDGASSPLEQYFQASLATVLQLARHWGMTVERRISIDEVRLDRGQSMTEAFGTSTAAVISPGGEDAVEGRIGPVSQKLYDTITGIQYGEIEDPFGWVRTI